jgi:hypothetical protein
MLTALVHCRSGPEGLTATLAALVEGVAEGVIADAVVITRHADDDVSLIAEATGAELAITATDDDPWPTGAAIARREWLFCLEAGDIPLDGWIEEIDRFTTIAAMEGHPIGRLRRRHADWRGWLSHRFAAFSPGPRAGDIVHAGLVKPVDRAATPARPRIRTLQAQLMRQVPRPVPAATRGYSPA